MTKQVLLGFTKHSIASFAARSMSSVSRAWNPEVEYNISKDFLAHITLLNPNNVSTSIQTARARLERLNREIDAVESVVALKPERMVHHAILVPTLTHIGLHDGEEYLSLGNSFREKERLVRRYVTLHIPAILDEFNTFRNSVENDVAREVGGFSTAHRQEEVLSNWRKILKNESGLSSTEQYTLQSLTGYAYAFPTFEYRSGKGMSERVDTSEDLISFIVDRICNAEGGRRIEQRIAPYIAQAVEQCDALHYIPENDTPTAMIMFGASASGKSTLRPYLREMFQREGKNWDDTMRLSTDIFRRSLLEIDSLPEECAPYFSRFTSAELRVIDKQLDAYLIRENGRHNILIDRFREKQEKELDKEIIDQTKDVRLYFIVVPPEQTIENSWERGQRIGRYKSVEELLFHCYDAYINMPGDFFGWLKSDKNVHFEFLDKTVPEFSPPRMIMSGNKKEVTVESVQEIIQVNQFSKINLYAKNLSELY